MTFRTNEEVRITGVLWTASNSTVTCSKVINWRDGSGNEYDASRTNATVKIYTSKSNYEYGVCSASWGTLTFTMKGLDASNSKTEVTSNKKQWRPWAKVAYVASASDLVDLDWDNTFTGTQTFAEDILFTGTTNPWIRPRGLTTAQMNALDMTGIDSAIIYNTTESEHYQYIGGAWSAVSGGSTQPNASITVAGKVEKGTLAQWVAWTSIGETGAPLFLSPDDIAKIIQGWNYINLASATDSWTDTYVTTATPTLTAYTTGALFVVTFAETNTTTTPTLNIDWLWAVTITDKDSVALAVWDITTNKLILMKVWSAFKIMSELPATATRQGITTKAWWTSADWALSISSWTTTLAIPANWYLEKNYTSVNITGGTLNFTWNGIVVIKCSGNFTMSAWTIDLDGRGWAWWAPWGWGWSRWLNNLLVLHTNAGWAWWVPWGWTAWALSFQVNNITNRLFSAGAWWGWWAAWNWWAWWVWWWLLIVECAWKINISWWTIRARGIDWSNWTSSDWWGWGWGWWWAIVILWTVWTITWTLQASWWNWWNGSWTSWSSNWWGWWWGWLWAWWTWWSVTVAWSSWSVWFAYPSGTVTWWNGWTSWVNTMWWWGWWWGWFIYVSQY